MYSLLFIISLAYFGYVVYHTTKGTLPVWFDKRLFKLKTDESYKDLDNKSWDSPIGVLSKVFSLSILVTSYMVLTYLIGWSSISKSNTLYVTVFLRLLSSLILCTRILVEDCTFIVIIIKTRSKDTAESYHTTAQRKSLLFFAPLV
jgi:hypothetical protein